MGVNYVETGSDVDPDLRERVLEAARDDNARKPWDLVDSVVADSEASKEETKDALKELMLEGKLEITAAGNVRSVASPA